MSNNKFDVESLFNIAGDLKGGPRNGIRAIQQKYGGEGQAARNVILRISNAMRACVLDWGKHGNFYAYYTNRNGIESEAGKLLIEGVQQVMSRFGDTNATRAAINDIFKEFEEEWNREGNNLSTTTAYDQEAAFPPGTSWGGVHN